jgi:GxxExxY protein
MALEHGEITEQIIGAAFEVYSILGYGFLEKVYQRAMRFGGPRSSSNGLSSEQLPIDGSASRDHWRFSLRVQSVLIPWLRLQFATAITN